MRIFHFHVDLIHQIQIIRGKAFSAAAHHQRIVSKKASLYGLGDLFFCIVNISEHNDIAHGKMDKKPQYSAKHSQRCRCSHGNFGVYPKLAAYFTAIQLRSVLLFLILQFLFKNSQIFL